jgi:hypothetical protein
MPEYPYTDTEERVFSDLSHGPGVRVVRDGDDVPADLGSTVVLRPGDVLVTDEPLPFFHAFLAGSTHRAAPAAEDTTADAADDASEPVEAAPVPAQVPRSTRRRPTADAASDTPPAPDAA